MSKPHRKLLALAVAACLQPGAGMAGESTIPTYAAGTGALSYTFFNLSGNSCTLAAYGGGGNPYAWLLLWAGEFGWINGKGGEFDQIWAGFFNPVGLGGSEENPSHEVTSNHLFYNNYDPLDASTVPSEAITLGNGQNQSRVIQSWELGPVSGNESINYPAMGDSWGIRCGANPSGIAVANLASAASVLQSNGPTSYPYNASLSGWFENSTLNPPAWAGCDNTSNPCGTGFTAPANQAGSLALNWNVASSSPGYAPTGGLWSGINYSGGPNSDYPATGLINAPMLPINLSSYAQSQQGNFNPNNPSQHMYYTPIYGGHFTLAIGDPFLISSYAAKMLWYSVISTGSALNDATTLSSLSYNLTNPASGISPTDPVFAANSYENDYVQWLMGSQSSSQNSPGAPGLAALAFQSTFQAASVPITHESVWGKIFTGLADVAVHSAVEATTFVPGGDVAEAVGSGAATTAAGALIPDMNSAITNSFTTTISAAAPLTVNAPTVINPTYAATNLFGLLLTNYGVQEQINTTMGISGGPSPLWANYSVTDACGVNNIQVSNNLFSGSCPNESGDWINNNASTQLPGGYVNVYAQTQTAAQMSIWDAILTGSDVVNNNGYIELGDNAGGIASFSPPVQLWNISNGPAAPTRPLLSETTVNTTFNLTTGFLTAQSYEGGYQGDNYTLGSLYGVALNYQSCVTDPWATGGVLAGFTPDPPSGGQTVVLGCTCIPNYTDGPAPNQANVASSNLLGGVVVGATTVNPGQTCPLPAS